MKRVAVAAFAVACGTQTSVPRPVPMVAVAVTAPEAVRAPPVVLPAPPEDPPPPLACIARLYGDTTRKDAGGWSLVLPDGSAVPYDDVRDVYELRYPTGPIRPITDVDFDPGRVRIDALFFETYGKSAKEVQAALVPVRLGGKTFWVHRTIASALRRVAARIDAAMKRDPTLARFFESPGGTFNWRHIAGTDELSMHSWAIAIDLDTKRANYWRNERQDRPLVWKNAYPQAIVDAFEAEGFIWGGRWYHFDTMHFEYRPELLDPACYPATGGS